MKGSFKWLLGGLMVLLLTTTVFAQSRGKLEGDRKQLLKEIGLIKKELSKVAGTKQESMDRIMWLQAQIFLREKLVNTISKEMNVLDEKMDETGSVVAALERDMIELKEKYSDMLFNAYKYRSSIDQLIFIFSADNFNDAIQRMRYVQQISQFRSRQAELIEETRKVLNDKLEEQEKIRAKKKALLDEQLSQKKSLNQERGQKDQLVTNLKDREKKLKKEIKKKEVASEKLAKKIEEVIAMEKARPMSADFAKLSSEFVKNQGKLPWPARGPIVRRFGTYPHPSISGIHVNNNGIDIRTKEGSKIMAIFKGEVRVVMNDPTFHMAVLINHGEYYTFYYNLQESFVKKGEKVVVGQEIGVAYTDDENGHTEVHLEIWKGTVKLNPALWISKP